MCVFVKVWIFFSIGRCKNKINKSHEQAEEFWNSKCCVYSLLLKWYLRGRVSLLHIRTHTHRGSGGASGEERFCACDVAFEPLSPDGLKLETEKHASVNTQSSVVKEKRKPQPWRGGHPTRHHSGEGLPSLGCVALSFTWLQVRPRKSSIRLLFDCPGVFSLVDNVNLWMEFYGVNESIQHIGRWS